jgi:hypothetical protein
LATLSRDFRPPGTTVTLSPVPDKEHPARTAGRYVRAARIAIEKDRERRAAEAAQRAAAAPPPPAQGAPPVDSAPPAPAPTPVAPAPAPATARPRRAPAPEPPARPVVDVAIYYVFLLSLVAVGLAALQIQMVTSGTVRVGIRLGLGIVLVLVAVPLLSNWLQAKERLTARIFKRIWGLDAPVSRSGRLMRKVGNDVMTIVGIVFLALGTFELLRAFVDP